MKFSTEREMAICFKELLLSSVREGNIELLEEFKAPLGIPDYVLIERKGNSIGYIISIELKLRNWKRALKQAFRYRSFSNESFVVIDKAHSRPAYENRDTFIHYNIGLASFGKDKKLEIHFYPQGSVPFSCFCVKKVENVLLDKENEVNSSYEHSGIFSSFHIESQGIPKSKFPSFFDGRTQPANPDCGAQIPLPCKRGHTIHYAYPSTIH